MSEHSAPLTPLSELVHPGSSDIHIRCLILVLHWHRDVVLNRKKTCCLPLVIPWLEPGHTHTLAWSFRLVGSIGVKRVAQALIGVYWMEGLVRALHSIPLTSAEVTNISKSCYEGQRHIGKNTSLEILYPFPHKLAVARQIFPSVLLREINKLCEHFLYILFSQLILWYFYLGSAFFL